MPVHFSETELDGVLIVECGVFRDERGFFSETYNQDIWHAAGFTRPFVQDNLSLSVKGTLRGLHYQILPHGMGKLVRAVTGAVFDVAVDLRRGSPTFGRWIGQTLSAENGLALWVPEGFAHGFVALEDDTYVYYKCTGTHAPEAERALRYNDPDVGVDWPTAPTVISDKDAAAPLLGEVETNFTYPG
ncbi:MAG: dTDP-4-dehydrorhamnose 3,5-epimerase [Candidatus Hydrogenedentes bacterium]|nr:dTDP-4-dehydrorhamnose 3,5-epimerase [Candidatus Hydrogenedentota bacterium]